RSGRTGRAGKKGVCVLLVPFTARRRAERLLNGAGVKGSWAQAPTAQKIRARDQEKIVEKLAELAAKPSEDDLSAGRELLKLRTAEELAAALVHLQRGLLP